ncbi:hypothetical protein [Rhodococcus artemisiae]|uniref:DUF1214 domain-containing protein n=1 Tax=Rhodococcus artemisiae TaxID=714159 RepID=A0ABU7LFK2_9NOCA|nr:hypothetical protein [Rhodococcus artemisiae]MEE2060335.1 hypothetical protein [Rhodococcus artemisiae]
MQEQIRNEYPEAVVAAGRRRLMRSAMALTVAAVLAVVGSACGMAQSDAGEGGETESAISNSQAHPAEDGGALATEGQRALETRARQILATDVVQQQIRQVQELYESDTQGTTSTGETTAAAAASAIGAAATQYAVTEDPDRPVLMWVVNLQHKFAGLDMPNSGYGIENPDNVYRQATVAGDARYEIRGLMPEQAPSEVHFEMRDSIPGTAALTAEGGTPMATLSSDAIETGPDGAFVVTVDSDPAEGRANHLQIPADGTSLLLVRDLLNDWSTEAPSRLDIVRVDGPPVAPEASVDQQAARTAEILGQIAPFWMEYFNEYYYTAPENRIRPVRERPGGRGLATGGRFALADDEALVFTVDPVGAKSLGVQISDPWGVAYPYREGTSSLNMTQAESDQDGTYTFVISRNDPGVHNWLDPNGHDTGMIALRWQSMSGEPDVEAALRSSAVVKVADLAAELPDGTVFVDPEERQLQQEQRAFDFDRRLTQ